MKRENPAKTFLRQYIGLLARVDALTRAIDQAMERAYNIGVTLKEIKVLSSPAEHDPMAADVCAAVKLSEARIWSNTMPGTPARVAAPMA